MNVCMRSVFSCFPSVHNEILSLLVSENFSSTVKLCDEPADLKWVVLVPWSKQVLLQPVKDTSVSRSAANKHLRRKPERSSRLFELYWNFFLSRNWSPSHPRSKLCVLAGPEPSGPEPVLLQVLSIYRPRQCAHGSEKSPQLQHKGSRDARVWEVKTSCFSAVWTNHQQRRFKDQADTFFPSCSVGFKLKDFSRSCKVSKSTDCS